MKDTLEHGCMTPYSSPTLRWNITIWLTACKSSQQGEMPGCERNIRENIECVWLDVSLAESGQSFLIMNTWLMFLWWTCNFEDISGCICFLCKTGVAAGFINHDSDLFIICLWLMGLCQLPKLATSMIAFYIDQYFDPPRWPWTVWHIIDV